MKVCEIPDENARILELMDAYNFYSEEGDYENALQAAQELVSIRGKTQDWTMQGCCQIALESPDEALRSFTRAIVIDPDYNLAWTNIGGLLANLERFDDALFALDKALELQPQNSVTLFNKGIVLNKCGKHDEAVTVFNTVVEIEPEFQSVWVNRGVALGYLGQYERALESFEQALLLDPNDDMALHNQGLILTNLNRYDEALITYNQIIKLNQRDVEAWFGRSVALTNLEKHDKALASFDRVIELEPNHSEAWFGRSILLYELENYEQALLACNISIGLGNQAAAVFLNRATILLALNRWEEGIVALDEAFNQYDDLGKPYSRDTERIICSLLFGTQVEVVWRSRIKILIEIYDKHRFVSLLSKELVQSIQPLLSPQVSITVARAWKEIWQELAGNRIEFQSSLRLLTAAICYREQKGDPHILQELSVEEQSLFQSILGVEKLTNELNETELMWQAGCIAITAREFLGRGVVWFEGDKPRYAPRQDCMPVKLQELVDHYDIEQEFLVIASNHRELYFVSFEQIGMDLKAGIEPISTELYEQELDSILTQLREKGLAPAQVSYLRRMTLAHQNGEFSLSTHSQEEMEIIQALYEEWADGNFELVVDFCRRHLQ